MRGAEEEKVQRKRSGPRGVSAGEEDDDEEKKIEEELGSEC